MSEKFANFYIERLISEIVELNKNRFIIETQLKCVENDVEIVREALQLENANIQSELESTRTALDMKNQEYNKIQKALQERSITIESLEKTVGELEERIRVLETPPEPKKKSK